MPSPHLLHANLEQLLKPSSDVLSHPTLQVLSEYGLKSASDVLQFLHSPAGKALEKMLHDYLILLAESYENQRLSQLEQALHKQRFLALLLLTALLKAYAKEDLERDIEIAMSQFEAANSTEQTSTTTEVDLHYLEQLYYFSTQLLQRPMEKQLQDASQLEEEIALLEQEAQQIDERHQILEDHLDELERYALVIEEQPKTTHITELQWLLNEVAKQIKQVQTEIKEIVESNSEQDIFSLFNQLNGLNLQTVGLEEMLAVCKGEKHYYNDKGKKVRSYQDAAFILSAQQVLHVDDEGNCYLLRAGQRFENLSLAEKAQAKHRFEQTKSEIYNLKYLFKMNKDTELNLHQQKRMGVYARSDNLQKEILELSNQYNLMQAAQASTAALIENPPGGAELPTPKPTLKPQTKQQKRVTFSTSQSYRQVLELMRTNPTPESISRLKKGLPAANTKLNQRMQAEIDQKIRPGNPIKPEMMKTLLRTIERFGVSAYKPSVSKIPRISPFNIHPNPYE